MKTSSHISSLDDPVVDEIRAIRAELAREANYDLHTICERIRQQEQQDPERRPATRAEGEVNEEGQKH